MQCMKRGLGLFSTTAERKYEETKSMIATAQKQNLAQSPLKMKFLVHLIRNKWVPDALAQLKFTPKHRAVDVNKILLRASAMAKLYYDAIPEELIVKSVMVTKGQAQKKMRIMGRGRTGFGYTRKSHVTVKVQKIDFDSMIRDAKTPVDKILWTKRKVVAQKKKESISTSQDMELKASVTEET